MSVRKFCLLLTKAKVGWRDKAWFPRWVRSYGSTVDAVRGELSITEAEVIRILQSLRDSGAPAW